jgi:hypothetical protein
MIRKSSPFKFKEVASALVIMEANHPLGWLVFGQQKQDR